ncbi:MAG TPA: HAD-IB family hydrolase, partial [Nocardioides sp.]|nr:HAD-IB family hydrolase [Nocardioides sp.]
MSRAAAFFDLDKTVIAKSSALAFTKEFQAGGLLSRTTLLRTAYSQLVFVMAGADHEQMQKMRQFMSLLVTGWDVETVRTIVADTLHNTVDPLVYAEALALIREHQEAGREVIIVSASGSEVVGPIGELLGVDHVIASRLEEKDGKYTG